MLFSPIVSYFTYEVFGLFTSVFLFQAIVCVYGTIYILKNPNRLKLTKIILLQIIYLTYIIWWSFFNGYFDQKGLINVTNINIFSVLIVYLMITLSNFTDAFIKLSIKIIKITVIASAITSIVQVLNSSFLDASEKFAGELIDTGNYYDKYQFRRLSIFGYIDPNELGFSFLPLLSILFAHLHLKQDKYLIQIGRAHV